MASGKNALRVLSLFSGCGGLDLGLEGGFTTDKAIEVTVCDFDSDIDDESAENSYWDECKKSGMQQFAPYIYHPQKQD